MSGAHLDARRKAILRWGRPVTLRRLTAAPSTYASVTLLAFSADYAPDELVPPLVQGDRRYEVMAEDLVVGEYPLPPREPDEILDGAESYTVLFAAPVYVGTDRIGWTISARGG